MMSRKGENHFCDPIYKGVNSHNRRTKGGINFGSNLRDVIFGWSLEHFNFFFFFFFLVPFLLSISPYARLLG